MPAWQFVDPLMVLDYLDDEPGAKRHDEDDSLESLLERPRDNNPLEVEDPGRETSSPPNGVDQNDLANGMRSE